MRKTAKALLFAVGSLIAVMGLVIGAAFSAALAFGTTALIVPGTGTHDVLTNTPYRDHAADRYINPAGTACTTGDGCEIAGVDYPAEFFPFVIFDGWCPGLSCDTWNASVNTGVTNLDGAVTPFKSPANTEDVIIFGYSQGGAVVSREMYNLAGLDQAVKDHITVVTIGNVNNPRGLFSRLGFLPTIPGLDISFGPNLPTDIGIKSVNYSFEYDAVGDAPSYWGNAFAMLNAIAAFEYVHGYYLVPDDDTTPDTTMPYGYDDISLAAAINDDNNRQTYQDATFVLIPQRGPLPIFQPLIGIGKQTGLSVVVDPLVALLNPVTKLLVNLGYDRITNPGIPQTLSLLPFNPFTFNPITFAVQFVQAIVQGVQDAIGVIGGASLSPPTPATANDVAGQQAGEVNTFARMSAASPGDTQAIIGDDQDETVADPVGNEVDQNTDPNVEQNPVDQNVVEQDSVNQSSVDQSGAEEAAAQAAAAAAEKEAAEKEAAAKEAAAKEAAEKEAAEKAAAEKAAAEAAEKATADAAEKAAAEAAEKARDNAEANNRTSKQDGAGPDGNDPVDDDAAAGTAEQAKTAA